MPLVVIDTCVVASLLILAAEATVMPPVNVVADAKAICLKAPFADVSVKPKPFITNGSVMVNALAPLNSIAAVLDTVVLELAVPADALPNASLFFTCNTPFVTIVAP